MKQNIGLASNVGKDILKDLKDGDILYSACYDHSDGETTAIPIIFRGYVDAPGNNKGVWCKIVEAAYYDDATQKYLPIMKTHKKEDGTTEEIEDIKVNDISVGLYLTKKDAFEAWEKVAKNIYDSACKAVKNCKEV